MPVPFVIVKTEIRRQAKDIQASSYRIFENVKNQIELNGLAWSAAKQKPLVGASFFVKSNVTTMICLALNAEALSSKTMDMAESDRILFEIAKQIEMESGGRAVRHLDHFLAGSGNPIHFETSSLLREDSGVREHVLAQLKNALALEPNLEAKSGKIPIFVDNFKNRDWYLAIGSFVLDWKFERFSKDKKHAYISLSGKNEYRWHPAELRFTRCLHVAGEALTKANGGTVPKAKNYTMIANRMLVELRVGAH